MNKIKKFIVIRLCDFANWLIELGPREGFGEKTPEDFDWQKRFAALEKEALKK